MHTGPPLIACGRGVRGGLRVPTSDPHTINACWFLFLLSAYLLVAEAASFDKKELCRSDTLVVFPRLHKVLYAVFLGPVLKEKKKQLFDPF